MRPTTPRSSGHPWWVSLLALTLAASLATAQESESVVPTADLPADLLRDAVEEGATPGAALWVLKAGVLQEELYLGRFHDNLVVPFDGASAWLSTAVVLTLADTGTLELDDPLIEYFPEVPDDKAQITLRQILSHTAGLATSHPCLAEPSASLESCVRSILEEPLEAPPGREFLYGAAGLQIAGRVAEIIGGGSWETVFQQRVAQPLGLARTSYGEASNPVLASGARGTVRDYGRFLSALLSPRAGSRPLLSPAPAVEMLTDQAAGTTRSYWPLETARGFGLGTWLMEDASGNAWATSPGILGFTPWLLRDRDFAAVTVVSARPGAAESLRLRLAPLLLLQASASQ